MRRTKRKTTFFISASSKEIPRVQALARELEARGGAWHCGYNWTLDFEVHELNLSREELILRAEWDLTGAMEADFFVALDGEPSAGRMVEIGARLAVGKTAWLVKPESVEPKDIFYYLCRRVATDRGLVSYYPCAS
jgi:hypothetical protein